jgi:hypothetical protein
MEKDDSLKEAMKKITEHFEQMLSGLGMIGDPLTAESFCRLLRIVVQLDFNSRGELLPVVYYEEGSKIVGLPIPELPSQDCVAQFIYRVRCVYPNTGYATEAWAALIEKDEIFTGPVSEHPARQEVVLLLCYGSPVEMWRAPIIRPEGVPATLGPWEKADGDKLGGRMIDPPPSTMN